MAGTGTETATDDLLADVRAAMAESGGEPVETPVAETPDETPDAPIETAQQTADRERDEAGRFKAKDPARDTLTLRADPAKVVKPPEERAAEQPKDPNALPPEIDKAGKHLERIPPPPGWKGAAKVDWDRMPRNVREALAADYAQVDQARAELAPLKELFDVNREFLVSQAGSVVEAQRQMMQFARMSVDNPVQLAEHILRARGLDPRAVFGGQPQQAAPQGQQPAPQTDVAQLVEQKLQERFQQQQTQQLLSQIADFGARPDRPYFNDVKAHMGALMQLGKAKTMDEAYTMACRADPTIHAQIESVEREAAEKAKAAEVARARAASGASLRGSPIPGVMSGQAGQHSSVLDDVRAAAAEVAGA